MVCKYRLYVHIIKYYFFCYLHNTLSNKHCHKAEIWIYISITNEQARDSSDKKNLTWHEVRNLETYRTRQGINPLLGDNVRHCGNIYHYSSAAVNHKGKQKATKDVLSGRLNTKGFSVQEEREWVLGWELEIIYDYSSSSMMVIYSVSVLYHMQTSHTKHLI